MDGAAFDSTTDSELMGPGLRFAKPG